MNKTKHKVKFVKFIIAISSILTLTQPTSHSAIVAIFDDSFTVSGVPGSVGAGFLGGRWGVWSSGSFTPIGTGNTGYVDLTPGAFELSIALDQTNNSLLSAGTQMALAIYTNGSTDSQSLAFSSSLIHAVLTDASWIAPTFTSVNNTAGGKRDFVFSSSTSALVGSFSFNGGSEQISLIPEPSTGALMMIGAVGLVALRRLRKV